MICCNCGGEHSAAYKGCEAHKRAVQVQSVRVKEKITYAEAVRKVETTTRPRPVSEIQYPGQNVS